MDKFKIYWMDEEIQIIHNLRKILKESNIRIIVSTDERNKLGKLFKVYKKADKIKKGEFSFTQYDKDKWLLRRNIF